MADFSHLQIPDGAPEYDSFYRLRPICRQPSVSREKRVIRWSGLNRNRDMSLSFPAFLKDIGSNAIAVSAHITYGAAAFRFPLYISKARPMTIFALQNRLEGKLCWLWAGG